jgi:hypothetical protein
LHSRCQEKPTLLQNTQKGKAEKRGTASGIPYAGDLGKQSGYHQRHGHGGHDDASRPTCGVLQDKIDIDSFSAHHSQAKV